MLLPPNREDRPRWWRENLSVSPQSPTKSPCPLMPLQSYFAEPHKGAIKANIKIFLSLNSLSTLPSNIFKFIKQWTKMGREGCRGPGSEKCVHTKMKTVSDKPKVQIHNKGMFSLQLQSPHRSFLVSGVFHTTNKTPLLLFTEIQWCALRHR